MRVIDLADEHQGLFAVCLEDWSPTAGSRAGAGLLGGAVPGAGPAGQAGRRRGRDGGGHDPVPAHRAVADPRGGPLLHSLYLGARPPAGPRRLPGQGDGAGSARRRRGGCPGAWGAGDGGLGAGAAHLDAGLVVPRAGLPQGRAAGDVHPRVEAVLPGGEATELAPCGEAPSGSGAGEGERRGVQCGVVHGGESHHGPRAGGAAAEFGDQVAYREIDTSERTEAVAWGRTDAVFIDGRQLRTGPPPSYEKMRKAIARRVRRLPADAAGGARAA